MTTMQETRDLERLMSPKEVAERWQLSVDQLAELRQSEDGPDYVRLGHRTVRYRLADIEAYEMDRLVELERNLKANAARLTAQWKSKGA
jgi:predicted DNA-binding transcriptional regulator AlpA